jgi:thiol-disulfide isomerase/thioredoxin
MNKPQYAQYRGCTAYPAPSMEDSYGELRAQCYECSYKDFTCSGEPKSTYPAKPPIVPEVLTIMGVKPTGLTYERKETLGNNPDYGAPNSGGGLHNNNVSVILYKTDWCGYCKQMKPVFDRVKRDCADKGINFSIVDCDKTPTLGINQYPTIVLIDNKGAKHKYGGTAEYGDLLRFVMSPQR